MLKYLNEIPEVYRPFVTVTSKARLKLTIGNVYCTTVLAATTQATLLAIQNNEVKVAMKLPFSDCETIMVYRTDHHEYILVFSGKAGICAAVDLGNQKTLETWTGISHVSIDYGLKPGKPVLVLKDQFSSVKQMCYTSRWENFPPVVQSSPSNGTLSVADAIGTGLQRQLNMTSKHLSTINEKNSLLLNELLRSVITFKDSTKKTQTVTPVIPSFTVPVVNSTKAAKESFSCEEHPPKLDLQFSPPWQQVFDRMWVVGSTLYNNSDQ